MRDYDIKPSTEYYARSELYLIIYLFNNLFGKNLEIKKFNMIQNNMNKINIEEINNKKIYIFNIFR